MKWLGKGVTGAAGIMSFNFFYSLNFFNPYTIWQI